MELGSGVINQVLEAASRGYAKLACGDEVGGNVGGVGFHDVFACDASEC